MKENTQAKYKYLIDKFNETHDSSQNSVEVMNNIFTDEEQHFLAKNTRCVTLFDNSKNSEYSDYDIGVPVQELVIDKDTDIDIVEDLDGTHSAYELHLIVNGFDIKHVHRDIHNNCDDYGGHIIVIASKDELWYVFISAVSDELHLAGTDCDHKELDTYEEAIQYVKDFTYDLCVLVQNDCIEDYTDGSFWALDDYYLKVCTEQHHDKLIQFFYSIESFTNDINENVVSMYNIDQNAPYNGTPDFRLFGDRFTTHNAEDNRLIIIK